MTRFLLICFAGALGTGTRYLVSLGASRAFGAAFPYGTLIVNLVGCFLIAAVVRVAVTTAYISETLRFTLTVGFMGGLTTYSSFNFETTKLLEDKEYGAAAINFGATVAGCFAAGLLGLYAAKKLFPG